MADPIQHEEKKSFRKSLSSMLTPLAKKNYNKVLASSYQPPPTTDDASSIYDPKADPEENLTDEEKAKRLVAERDAKSPTGTFILGTYKPLSATEGYGDFYIARGFRGK